MVGKGRVQKSRLRFSGLVVSGHWTDRADEKLIDFLGLPLVLFVFSLGGYIVAADFIVLNVDDLPVCIVVDSVQQVIDIDLQDVRPIPIKRRQKLLDGMITLENGTVLMSFDCKSLVSS